MSSREHLNRLWFNAVRILYGYARQNIGVVLVVGFGTILYRHLRSFPYA